MGAIDREVLLKKNQNCMATGLPYLPISPLLNSPLVTRGWIRGLPQLPSFHTKSQVPEIHKH
jgi:hypothetical protein